MSDLEIGFLEKIALENIPVLSHLHPRIQNGFPQPPAPGRLCRAAPLLQGRTMELFLHNQLNGNSSCSFKSCVCLSEQHLASVYNLLNEGSEVTSGKNQILFWVNQHR